MISRVHATLEPISKNGKQEGWKLVDHSSRNGSFVNNMKVSEVILEHGDQITFGGGGLLPYGSMKHQIDSEFTYTFLNCDDASEDVTLEWRRLSGRLERKKKDDLGTMDENDAVVSNQKVKTSKRSRMLETESASASATKRAKLDFSAAMKADVPTKTVVSPTISKLSNGKPCPLGECEDQKAPCCSAIKTRRDQELLHNEFICPVCLDYFLQTQTLACGHSFCSPCISKCLEGKRQCPVCRDTVSKRPVRSCALDGAIRALLQQDGSKDDEVNVRYKKRQKQWRNEQRKERRTASKLRAVIQRAKDDGKHFLNINDRWNEEERDIFRKGVVMYRGSARQEYCATTGLSLDFIDSKMFRELIDVAINVGVLSEDGYNMENEFTSLSTLRDRLHMFILYG